MVVRKGTEGVGTIKRTPVKSKSPSLFTGRAARGKITIIESKTPGGEAKAVAVDPSKISRQEAIAEAKAGRIIATEEGPAKITKGQQRELRAQAEAPVREKFKRQFEEAHERVAQKELIASRDKGIRGKLRRDLPQFISAVKEEFPKEEVTSPGFLTTSKTDLARRALLVGTKETRVELAKKEQSVLAGVTHRALGIPQFGLEHPVITGGVILAVPVAGAIAGAAGISAGVVATAGEVAIIGLGAVQTGLGIQSFRAAETPFEKGAAGFDIAAGATAVVGGAALRFRRLTGAKITRVDTTSIAREQTRVDKTSGFEIGGRARVGTRKPFGRERFVDVEIAGESIVQPSGTRPGFFEARTGFAARVPDKQVSLIGKTKELIKVQQDITKGVGATEIAAPGQRAKFVSSKIGFRAAKTPKGELVLTTGRTTQITPKGVKPPFTERGITIVQRLEAPLPTEFGFGLKVFPKTVQAPPPSPTLTGIEQVAREAAITAVRARPSTVILPHPISITPTPTRAPQVTRQAPQSIITQQIAPQIMEAPKVERRFLIKTSPGFATEAGVTPTFTSSIAIGQQIVPAQIVQPDTAIATKVGTQAIAAQVPFTPTPTQQRAAQAFAEPSPTPPPSLFGLPKGAGSRKPKARKPTAIRLRGGFPPSLVAIEFGITATAAERKRIEKTGLGVLGVRPLVISPRRKKKK